MNFNLTIKYGGGFSQENEDLKLDFQPVFNANSLKQYSEKSGDKTVAGMDKEVSELTIQMQSKRYEGPSEIRKILYDKLNQYHPDLTY